MWGLSESSVGRWPWKLQRRRNLCSGRTCQMIIKGSSGHRMKEPALQTATRGSRLGDAAARRSAGSRGSGVQEGAVVTADMEVR